MAAADHLLMDTILQTQAKRLESQMLLQLQDCKTISFMQSRLLTAGQVVSTLETRNEMQMVQVEQNLARAIQLYDQARAMRQQQNQLANVIATLSKDFQRLHAATTPKGATKGKGKSRADKEADMIAGAVAGVEQGKRALGEFPPLSELLSTSVASSFNASSKADKAAAAATAAGRSSSSSSPSSDSTTATTSAAAATASAAPPPRLTRRKRKSPRHRGRGPPERGWRGWRGCGRGRRDGGWCGERRRADGDGPRSARDALERRLRQRRPPFARGDRLRFGPQPSRRAAAAGRRLSARDDDELGAGGDDADGAVAERARRGEHGVARQERRRRRRRQCNRRGRQEAHVRGGRQRRPSEHLRPQCIGAMWPRPPPGSGGGAVGVYL